MSVRKWGGAALLAGGALTFVVNAVVTPLLPAAASFADTAVSPTFVWRQGLAALAALLLLAGSVGLARHQAPRGGRVGAAAFALAFVGSVLLFAHEWSQLFLVHALARSAPAALVTLEAEPGPNGFDLSAMTAITTFTLGWLGVALALIRSRAVPRRAPLALIAGFFAVPLLSAVVQPVWAAALGSVALAAGWIMMGMALLRTDTAGPPNLESPAL